jgi:outer membrane protein assembly factor BamB
VDQHGVSFGEIPGTAAVAQIGTGDPTVFVVGGGTLYALDALTGAYKWSQDTDPAKPTSSVETESSPVVDLSTTPPEVLIGNDTNQSSGIALTGLMAFNAQTGALLWKYEPETDRVVHDLTSGDGTGNACGDVWSSPALDAARGLVMFATGDCPQTAAGQFDTIETVYALNVHTGTRVWDFPEPSNAYDTYGNPPNDGDTDFGASPIITGVNDTFGHPIVVEAGKSGYVYGLDEANGTAVWQVQAAQAGQLSPQLVGAVGGFIGSPALGVSNGKPAVFLTSAIFTPLTGAGADLAAPPYPACAGFPSTLPGLPVCLDTSLAGDPTRVASLHAVSVSDGSVLWQAPISTPTYAPATYSNGVVYAPSTTSFAMAAYNADTGTPLSVFPLVSSGASGASIVGSSIFLGSGISEGGVTVPGLSGIWSFTVGANGIPPSVSSGQLPSAP